MTPLDRLERELEAAAERQIAARPRRRRWPLGVFGVTVAFGVAAGAWAATALLSPGKPVPFGFGRPVAGEAQGAPLPGTVKFLTTTVADPAGGPPWGMRYWETDRKYACVQVGRVYEGKLGQITGGRVFHELRVGVTGDALSRCFLQDGSGHAFAAVHTDARAGGRAPSCPLAICKGAARTIDFGLLGPNARSFTYRADGREHTGTPLGEGGYLIVQKHLKPIVRVFGFHHKDPKLNLRGPVNTYLALTPASQVIRRVEYAAGTCTVHLTQSIFGACNDQAGYTPIPQPTVGDVRTRIRLRLLADGRTFRVRFRARQPVIDGRSAYAIQIEPKDGRNSLGTFYEHNLRAGALVKTTLRAHRDWRGTYVVTVRFRTVRARPGPVGSPAWPGVLVGRAEITF
jgi:hypothetical protein